MPELPEVETVRDGLDRWVSGRLIEQVAITHPRAVRRHQAGPVDLAQRLAGATVRCASRRGKYLWLPLDGTGVAGTALVAHLGMSGQLLVSRPEESDPRHLHVRIRFADGGRELRFVDQRTFGGLALDELVPATDLPAERLPAQVAHIARDPLDPHFDAELFARRLRRRRTALKRALLDQTLISGIGNIYADEALWRAKLHGERLTSGLSRAKSATLLEQVRAVLGAALAAGGTSFDALYVDVDGASGYFGRSLAVYGRADEPCLRCGHRIRRVAFMNRSSYYCPVCQLMPRSR